MRDTGGEYLIPRRLHAAVSSRGTRRLEHLAVVLNDKRGPRMTLEFIPNQSVLFSLMGLGYTNKAWEHGAWRGEAMVDENAWPERRAVAAVPAQRAHAPRVQGGA
jgi:hypothetical protein